MSRINTILLISSILIAQGCSSAKTYENDVFPPSKGSWLPINPENFGKTEAQRIYEGRLGK